ncbi:TMV resistance protein N, partial [Mucuna pruriens]
MEFSCASYHPRYTRGEDAEENPMSDNVVPQIKNAVFVSFRGEDIRHGFLSHLIEAFDMKKIYAFVDDNLERGDEIWPSLVREIEGSFISLIIFSQDYASSRWCLEELVAILEYREKYERIVIPVFYHVEPTHVRHQSGSYKNAFAKHGSKHKTKVQLWRHALNKSADLSGIESSKFR